MTIRARDRRDDLADRLTQFIEIAITDATKRDRIVEILGMQNPTPPLPPWPEPDLDAARIADASLRAAITCLHLGAAKLGITSVESNSRTLPAPRISPPSDGRVAMFAPLTSACLEPAASYEAAMILTYLYSTYARAKTKEEAALARLAAEFGDKSVRLNLLSRLNGFLALEADLWLLARQGGHTGLPAYAIRYSIMRWLWSPEVGGRAFCLQCGAHITFTRLPKNAGPRQPRCRHCARGERPAPWPAHAICPAFQGTWWLRCDHPGCTSFFVGRAQARYCDSHRSATITSSQRRRP